MIMKKLIAATFAAILSLLPVQAAEQASYVTPTSGPMSMATYAGTYLNPALRALASCSWGTSAPTNGPSSAALPYQCWADTTTNPVVLKMYDGTSWVTYGKLNTSAHTWTPVRAGTDLGTASIATTGTSGATVPFLNGANTWSAAQTFNGNVAINPTTGIGGVVIQGPAAASTTLDVFAVAGQSSFHRFGNSTNGIVEHQATTTGDYCLNHTGGATCVFASIRSGAAATTMYLKSGYVGLGVSSPLSPLQIKNNVASGFLDNYSEYQALFYDGGGAGASYGIGVKSGAMVFNAGTGGGFSWDQSAATTVMLLDSAGTLWSLAHIATSAAANALAVGRQGATNPAFQVDASAASSATGLKVTAQAAGGAAHLSAISSGTNETLVIDAKGSGQIYLGQNSTGSAVSFRPMQFGSVGSVAGQQVWANATSGTIAINPVTGALGSSVATLPAGTYTFVGDGLTQTLTNKTLNCANNTCTVRIGSDVSGLGTGVATAAAVNGGSAGALAVVIATGTKALATSAISSATCSSAQTDTATGAATTDVVDFGFAADPTSTTGYSPATSGMLTIIPWVTTNTVNFKVCNNTAGSITPGAVSLNWRVRR